MWIYADLEPTIKTLMFLAAVLLAFRYFRTRSLVPRRWSIYFQRISHRPWMCAAILFATSILISVVLSSFRTPQPWVHDEFSYLLASDTFCNGRLSNPVHPLAEHFESFHILVSPSYSSKYPPANALFLALGQLLFGMPISGVWAVLALGTVATYWMLRGWTNAKWALIGGFLVAINTSLLHAWGQSYWGGGVAFLGGALAFGGIRRLVNHGRTIDACLCGCGLILLANSRPVEGFLSSLPIFAVLIYWLFTNHNLSLKQKLTRMVVPMVLMGAVGLTAMGIYNQAVTGSATKFPYQAHDQKYSASAMLIWKQPPNPAPYNHDRFQSYYVDFARARQLSLRSTETYLLNLKNKYQLLWNFFPLAMGICLLSVPLLWKDRWSRLGILLIGGLLLFHSCLAASWIFPHYLAPVTALFFVLSIQGLRKFYCLTYRSPLGPFVVRVVLIFAILKLIPLFLHYQKQIRIHPRTVVESQLLSTPKRDLVIVSYSDRYRITDEWVYNDSDIDSSPIVWARDMGTVKNARLIKYFANRKVWRWHLENDDSMTLEPLTNNENNFATTVGSKP